MRYRECPYLGTVRIWLLSPNDLFEKVKRNFTTKLFYRNLSYLNYSDRLKFLNLHSTTNAELLPILLWLIKSSKDSLMCRCRIIYWDNTIFWDTPDYRPSIKILLNISYKTNLKAYINNVNYIYEY